MSKEKRTAAGFSSEVCQAAGFANGQATVQRAAAQKGDATFDEQVVEAQGMGKAERRRAGISPEVCQGAGLANGQAGSGNTRATVRVCLSVCRCECLNASLCV